ncbi:hypothetical protein E1261_13155 [Kribbella albertanoniae]|uniref:Uncharacterized protein n=1 Tax=Kribbella albertanoniae TaxID=1266829 RepID=A0A4R4Q6C4_9ACTN|nr:hypothetical protein E1261_13155 [Kribbella albertanoniae]
MAQRTGLRRFDFDQQPERAAIGQLLGEIVDNTRGNSGVMLSALVQYLGANDAGPGFYKLAVQLGLLEKHASAATRDRFWIEQVKLTYQEFGSK